MIRLILHFLLLVVLSPFARAQEPDEKALAEVGTRINRLGLGMFSAIRSDEPGNMATSPWASYRTLVLLHECTGGETRREIGAVLGGSPVADSALIQSSLIRTVDMFNIKAEMFMRGEPGQRVDLIRWQDVSAAWVDESIKIRPEFSASLRRIPETHVRSVDFSGNSLKVMVDVNSWISKVTGGRIPRMVARDTFTKDTQMVLTSALYFKAAWGKQFDERETRPEPFTLVSGKVQPVPTMRVKSEIASVIRDDFTVISLGSSAGSFRLLLIVPKAVDGLAAVEAKLTPELLRDLDPMKATEIEFHLPRFRVPALSHSLQKALAAQGIRAAFDRTGKADFSGITGKSLYVDQASEACDITVDERGLSGAGANMFSGSLFREGPLPTNTVFRVDRPFLFAFQHVASGACLFVGRITDPRCVLCGFLVVHASIDGLSPSFFRVTRLQQRYSHGARKS